jgi:eukaryotic-like serine/threonine-protein kinase
MPETKAVADDSFVGRVIAVKYRVVGFIAKGGMGEVYEGLQLQPIQRPVAIKALRLESNDPLYRRRFFNEAAMSASLSHPNVVQIFDYGVADDNTCYIVMELLRGEPLSSLLKRERRLAPALAMQVARDVCSALMAAHAEGFIHRDLKPSNLFVVDRQARGLFVKVLDFGLAKRLEVDNNLTQTGTFLGSPHYMSPEQIVGGDVSEATDIYNLGLVIYRMVVGRLPFTGEVTSAVLVDHATKPPPPFAEIAPDLEPMPHVEWIVTQCLRKNPKTRFKSVQELAKALEAAELLLNGTIADLQMDLVDGVLYLPANVALPSQLQANILIPQKRGLVDGPPSTIVLATALVVTGGSALLIGLLAIATLVSGVMFGLWL